MSDLEYWDELVRISFDDHGITATEEQIACVAADADSAHENYGLSHYMPTGPSQTQLDLDRARRELADERDKILCTECKGSGEEISYGGTFMGRSQCSKCRGEGRHMP